VCRWLASLWQLLACFSLPGRHVWDVAVTTTYVPDELQVQLERETNTRPTTESMQDSSVVGSASQRSTGGGKRATHTR
jgi:hypothetical protein